VGPPSHLCSPDFCLVSDHQGESDPSLPRAIQTLTSAAESGQALPPCDGGVQPGLPSVPFPPDVGPPSHSRCVTTSGTTFTSATPVALSPTEDSDPSLPDLVAEGERALPPPVGGVQPGLPPVPSSPDMGPPSVWFRIPMVNQTRHSQERLRHPPVLLRHHLIALVWTFSLSPGCGPTFSFTVCDDPWYHLRICYTCCSFPKWRLGPVTPSRRGRASPPTPCGWGTA